MSEPDLLTPAVEQTVEQAERVLDELKQKRALVETDMAAIVEQLEAIGYEVHAGGDKAARKRHDDLVAKEAKLAGEKKSLDGAIKTAMARCDVARANAAAAADRERALALRTARYEELELCEQLDAAFAAVTELAAALEQQVARSHALGAGAPNSDQCASYGTRCVLAWIGKLPRQWRRDIEVLPPNQQRTFAERWSDWIAADERAIALRLGEQQNEEKAA